jgi:vacuolar-type H+-ATPase subunit C/Vma6
MQTAYIYSASRVNALSEFLLTKTDIDRLLVAAPGAELHAALKETYLAPYVARLPQDDTGLALEETLIDAKKLIYRIAPKGRGGMLRVLWIQYDVHNLRVFAKGSVRSYSYEQCLPYFSRRGRYTAERMQQKIEDRRLDDLYPGWQRAYDEATELVASGKLSLVDGLFDELVFATDAFIIDKYGDAFMRSYHSLLVDFHNLKSRLRHLTNETVRFHPAFVEGGSVPKEVLETLPDTIAAFARFGGEGFWKEAIEFYQATGSSARIDARTAEYLLVFTKERAYDMFSSASLVLYYLKCRQAAANIRTIVAGKESGMSEADIRANLRMAYVNN